MTLLAIWGVALTVAQAGIDYTVTLEADAAHGAALAVEMRLSGDADGRTDIHLPDSWANETRLSDAIRDIEVAGGVWTREGGGSELAIEHDPGAQLTVRYRIVQDWEGRPSFLRQIFYRPVIEPDHLYAFGAAVFARPEGREDAAVSVAFPGDGLVAIASDLQHGDLDVAALDESILVGGDFDIDTRPAGAGMLRLAVSGQFDFDPALISDTLVPMIDRHNAYWNDPLGDYLVTVIEAEGPPNASAVAGTGLTDAFAFFVTANAEAENIVETLRHEHLHSWIPPRLAEMPVGETEPQGYWFSEGFTEFYTWRIGVLTGSATPQAALADLDGRLAGYSRLPHRDLPNEGFTNTAFWADEAMAPIPYLRGFFLALDLDTRLRADSAGDVDLDDVMRAMAGPDPEGQPAERLVATIADLTGLDYAPAIAAALDNPADWQPDPGWLSACGRLDWADARFHVDDTGVASPDCRAQIAGEEAGE